MLFVVMGWTMVPWPFVFYQDVWAYDVAAGVVILESKNVGKQNAPLKINMEPKDHPIEKDNHLPSTSIFGFQPLIFQVYLIFVGK